MEWLTENIGSILLCLAVVALIAGLVFSLVKKKKQGKTSCGCGCANCAMNGTCHSATKQKEEK